MGEGAEHKRKIEWLATQREKEGLSVIKAYYSTDVLPSSSFSPSSKHLPSASRLDRNNWIGPSSHAIILGLRCQPWMDIAMEEKASGGDEVNRRGESFRGLGDRLHDTLRTYTTNLLYLLGNRAPKCTSSAALAACLVS